MTPMQYRVRAYQPSISAPERAAGIAFIAALHAGVVYALLTMLGFVPLPKVQPPIDGHVIIVDRVNPLPPPPPSPHFPPPRVDNPIVPPISVQLEPGPRAITEPIIPPQGPPVQEGRPQVATVDPPRPPPIVFTPARAIAATHTIPDYPPVSRRLGEPGTLRLNLSVAADGSVSDARVESSSGHTRLDEAAVQWVKAHWRYEPAHEGAKPVVSTVMAVVTFKLQ